VVFDGVAETVDFEASRILDQRYVHLQTPLRHAGDDFDDASEKNLKALQAKGAALVGDHGDLERVAAILARNPRSSRGR
jgi:hypothetical protein